MEQSDGGHIPENEFTTKQWIVYSNGLDIFRISPDGTGQINLTAHDCACRNYSPAVYGQMIAFSRENPDGRGNTALYIMDMNGDNQRDLIPDLLTYLITNILWSPNGQRLLFAAMASDGTDKLYSVSITGDIAELAIQPYVRAWSPDSQNIFLVKIADSNWDIYLLNAAGGNQINLSNHPDRDYDPSGAPDGNKVVFASNRTGNYDIHVVSVDGNNLINLTKSPADDSHPMWSPVDNKIAFVSKQGELFDLYLMNSNGDDLHRLTNTGYSLIVKTVWSPDGRSIAFVAYQADSSRYSLLVISLQRSSLTTLVDSWNSDLYNPIWADDGGSIAFVSAGQLFVVNADGSGLLKLADEVQDDSISWAR
jgi:TolB protein